MTALNTKKGKSEEEKRHMTEQQLAAGLWDLLAFSPQSGNGQPGAELDGRV